ncbi:uncharacterized protein LOC114338546 isoform X2 [Diabrotica virgifera virgifera]|uniref:Uncharacterized protein LOC114338546 isoform X2 n=1 Tax=Diabrotica virgifera virgifera TaxID=50390 RepID=A0A6P7GIE2_DIAVI|nr:uncharacterized protein LOC114338546 isoform X2 [Diabrotica virgifera virgifera]
MCTPKTNFLGNFKMGEPCNQKLLHKKLDCPIYIHEYRHCVDSNFSDKRIEKYSKFFNQNPKRILNKIEETYWATWKPSNYKTKETNNKERKHESESKETYVPKKQREMENNNLIGDAAQELIEYVNKPTNVAESISEKIKTSIYYSEKKLSHLSFLENQVQVNKQDPAQVHSLVAEANNLDSDKIVNRSQIFDNTEEKINSESSLKLLKHIDSFIIILKKQLEKRESHFEQPKCIKLYKTSGKRNYIKGGTYPLKSSKKKEVISKGNFRLGPPGQLMITNGGYNKRPLQVN